MIKAKPKTKTRARSAKTGRIVSAKFAKKHKATTVREKREKVMWRGYVAIEESGAMAGMERLGRPLLWEKSLRDGCADYGEPIRVKLVRT